SDRQSAIPNLQSPICDLQWAISNLQSPRPFPNIHPLPCFSPWEAREKSPKRLRPHPLRRFQGRKRAFKKSDKGSATEKSPAIHGPFRRGLRWCSRLHEQRYGFTPLWAAQSRLPVSSPPTRLLSSSAGFPTRPPSMERCTRLSACN